MEKKDHTWSQKAVLKTEGVNDGDAVEYTVNTKEIAVKYNHAPEVLNHDNTTGDVEVVTAAGDNVTFVGVAGGTFLPVQVLQVVATSTTATNILACW